MKNKLLLISISLLFVAVVFQGCSKDDTTSPLVVINGDAEMVIGKGDTFTDPGATASDDEDGSVTVTSDASSVLNVNEPGVYTITYSATDKAGNVGYDTRTVVVNWKNSQLSAYSYVNIESDSSAMYGTVLPDSVGATIQNSSTSTYHFTFQPILQHSITSPIIARVHDGTKISIESQKPNGPASLVTVVGVGTGTVSHNGSQIILDFKVAVTDENNPGEVIYCTIHARAN